MPLQAGKHLEEAVGCLRPFTTTLARTARYVLALKLNAFGLLKDCGPESRFYDASIFFNEGGVGVPGKRLADGGSPYSRGLWVDEYVERLLDAVSHFNRGEFDLVEATVARIRQLQQFQEPNNRDKVILLKARAARALDQRETAMRAYVQLFHHPLFGREAESYCE